ncbi:MAG: DNA repair protein RecO [Chitinophagales bacterium]|nr:DNA repair protein RecO [Chitinophagales bacterium]
MIHKTKGIVLHTIKFNESSIITKIYTADFGLQSFIVKGVRSAGKSGKAALFSVMNILELEMYHRENKGLQYLKEFRPAFIFKTIQTDILKSSIALFLAEVLGKCIQEEEANHNLYYFIEQTLVALDESPKAESNLHLTFLLGFTKHLGFFPNTDMDDSCAYFDLQDGNFTREIPVHSYFVAQPHTENLKKLLAGELYVPMNVADRNFLLEKMLLYYQLHLQNFRKVTSHHVLHEVLESFSS